MNPPARIIQEVIEEDGLRIKVLRGPGHPHPDRFERFDRLQRSLAPLRRGKHPAKGIHYVRHSERAARP